MRLPGVRAVIVLGTLSVIATGVLVGVRASAAPPRIGPVRDYSCSSGDYTGTITIKWHARTSGSIAGADSVAGIWYTITTSGGVGHGLKKTIPFVPDGHARVQVVDAAVFFDPENDVRGTARRSMVFETGEGTQDGDLYELTGPYFREIHGGPFRFSFEFATGGATPDNDECTVELSSVFSDRDLAGGGEHPTYGCEDSGFVGSIRIKRDGREPEDAAHVVSAVDYKVDKGKNKGGNKADIRVEAHHPEAIQVFETTRGRQDNEWWELPQRAADEQGRTTDQSVHELEISFIFDRRGRFGFVGIKDPKCTLTATVVQDDPDQPPAGSPPDEEKRDSERRASQHALEQELGEQGRLFACGSSFRAADPSRVGLELDLGHNWVGRDGNWWRVSWLESTGDVIAVPLRGAVPAKAQEIGPVLWFGTVKNEELVRALLQHSENTSLDVARAAIERAPQSQADIEAYLAAHKEKVAAEQLANQRARRAAYKVVQLRDLPPVDASALEDAWYYRDLDWRKLAQAAVDALDAGVDPLNGDARRAFAQQRGLTGNDARQFERLFSSPIHLSVSDAGIASLRNGRHRVLAMRAQGVEAVVIEGDTVGCPP